MEKYGVEYFSQTEVSRKNISEKNSNQSQEILDKRKNTVFKKYGVYNVSQEKSVRERISINSTKMNKDYKIDYSFRKIEIQNKIQITKNINKFNELNLKFKNVEFMCSLPEFTGTGYYKKYKFKCNICQNEFQDHIYSHVPRCPLCYPKVGKSIYEKEISQIIQDFGVSNIVKNTRKVIYPYELDVYLPELKIAIEIDGLYWHSNIFKENHYHLKKSIQCENKGIHLIHVFESEWIHNRNYIINLLFNIIKDPNYIEYKKQNEFFIVDKKYFNLKNHDMDHIADILPQPNFVKGTRTIDQPTDIIIYDCGHGIYRPKEHI